MGVGITNFESLVFIGEEHLILYSFHRGNRKRYEANLTQFLEIPPLISGHPLY